MNVNAPRNTSSQFQVQSPASEPASSRQSVVAQRPENAFAQEWARDSFEHQCPCKHKAQMLGLS